MAKSTVSFNKGKQTDKMMKTQTIPKGNKE